ncbi:MAG: coproporphyrinogen III oxidase family protein [Treponema sp.]|nr:coproporphyrinogen III oxidase family protein [Treponema sp.]
MHIHTEDPGYRGCGGHRSGGGLRGLKIHESEFLDDFAPGRGKPPGAGGTVEASLYIHIPFCAGACDYCDFYSTAPRGRRRDRLTGAFIEALLLDAEKTLARFARAGNGPDRQGRRFPEGPVSRTGLFLRVPTLYIGGGTPSLLGAAGMTRLLGGLMPMLPPLREFTVEANPESLDEAFLRTCRDFGVTRISLGVQTFHEPSRRSVHRVGDGSLLPEKLALTAEYYGGSFSADLITGLPCQTEALVLEDIERLLAFNPGHVSLYALTVEEGTPLSLPPLRRGKSSVPFLPDGETADRLWLAGRDALEQAGYDQYEVSNFSLPGKQSVHNIRYWRMKNWLGLGPAASGTIIDDASGTGRRYTAAADVDAYIAAAKTGSPAGSGLTEELDSATLIKESFLMGFRCIEGPDRDLFRRRFSRDVEELIPITLEAWRRRGLAAAEKTALTREGLLWLDPFLLDAFKEAESQLK